MGDRGTAPTYRTMVNITPRPLIPQEERYSFNIRFVGFSSSLETFNTKNVIPAGN
jgi:hypothetical protein